MIRLPKTATAPFCPSEVRGTVEISATASRWTKITRFAGPGLLVSVGYMDPGNWATDIAAGSQYGYDLLFVVVFSSLAAIMLQWMAMRLGIATGLDLAQLSRQQSRPIVCRMQWFLAELSIVACDLAEVLGGALAFHMLLGVSLLAGVALTSLDTLIVLGLKGQKFRELEAVVFALIATIGGCFLVQLWLIEPIWPEVARGMIPDWRALADREPLYLAIGMLGATVMPHNLYLHSSIVQTRLIGQGEPAKREAIKFLGIDTVVSLSLAMAVNAAILILAAAAFHAHGFQAVAEIEDAYHLLDPIVGTSLAGGLFAVALLASGQNSTFTGTVAGQVILEGFLEIKIPCWQRRLITRSLALIPAFVGVAWLGDGSVGKLLILSQVVLSLQLPFALYPLTVFTGDRRIMGGLVNSLPVAILAWALFALITAANVVLLVQLAA
ncbi:Nramp family divalent metal transporter [Telmatospirillum sp.]|uniref:Nramp family divalent metal transporter n=1 Tax=Telmatospirillum sp. TaxID=2079197 RepID=UPI002850166B|nr:Nramp family divalent metal transporter [Telmatospirillum sp.]MDR3435314.1 Nramp family divalent metal transporter [Telmatospirillum sp.]